MRGARRAAPSPRRVQGEPGGTPTIPPSPPGVMGRARSPSRSQAAAGKRIATGGGLLGDLKVTYLAQLPRKALGIFLKRRKVTQWLHCLPPDETLSKQPSERATESLSGVNCLSPDTTWAVLTARGQNRQPGLGRTWKARRSQRGSRAPPPPAPRTEREKCGGRKGGESRERRGVGGGRGKEEKFEVPL
jgi:hypothetical protein